jgi:hypothetical protein
MGGKNMAHALDDVSEAVMRVYIRDMYIHKFIGRKGEEGGHMRKRTLMYKKKDKRIIEGIMAEHHYH